MTDDIRRLLGGYATGTLTAEEREALYQASLHDQTLFEALADEQALHELLEDSSARAALLQATESARFSMGGILRDWFDRPKAKVLVATACVLVAAIGYRAAMERPKAARQTVEIAATRTPPEQMHEPAAVPAPKPVRERASPQAKRVQPAPAQAAPPQTVAPAPSVAPPAGPIPAPEASVALVGEPAASQVRYTVLRRTKEGEYHPVPEEFLFGPDDQIRLRVEANRPGLLTVSNEDRATLFAGNVSPRAPVVIPQDISIGDRDRRVLELRFAPLTMALLPDDRPAANAFRSGARLMSSPREAAEKQEAAQKVAAPAEQALTLQVVLKRKR
jgi:hypothetical protein